MTASICGYCGYSRSIQVAGCDHATLPAAGVCQLPPGHAGDHDPAAQMDPVEGRCALPAAGEEMAADNKHLKTLRAALEAMREAHCWGDEEHRARNPGCRCASCITHAAFPALDAIEAEMELLRAGISPSDFLRRSRGLVESVRRAQGVETALAAEREKSALLAAELVDLQRQVVGRDEALVVLGTELEQERRECGRLRADLESARQLLDGEGA